MPSSSRGRTNDQPSTTNRSLRTRSSSAKIHSGIVDVAKKLLDTVDGGRSLISPMMRVNVNSNSNTYKRNHLLNSNNKEDFDVEETEEEDVEMDGQNPTILKRTTMKTNRRDINEDRGTPKDEKQVERVVALMRLILTAKKVKEDKVPALIAPNLYLGSIGAAQSEEQIKEKGITHILTVARGFDIKSVDGVQYMTVEVADRADADIRSHFPACFEFISAAVKNGGNVLVHCFAGRSRSASVCAAYVMCHENIRLDEALMRMRLARPQINPNAGFMAQLNQLDEDLMKWRYKTGQEKMKEQLEEITSAQSQNRDNNNIENNSKFSTSDSYENDITHDNNKNDEAKKREMKNGAVFQHPANSASTESNKSNGSNDNTKIVPTTKIQQQQHQQRRRRSVEATRSKENSSDNDNCTPYKREALEREVLEEVAKADRDALFRFNNTRSSVLENALTCDMDEC